MVCEFCDSEATHHKARFAGDHSPPYGPFEMCDACFAEVEDLYGFCLDED